MNLNDAHLRDASLTPGSRRLVEAWTRRQAWVDKEIMAFQGHPAAVKLLVRYKENLVRAIALLRAGLAA